MKFFLDWARTKKIVCVNEKDEIKEMNPKNVDFSPGSEVYVETGFSSKIMYRFIENGCKVCTVSGKILKDFRGSNPKTDLGDAQLLKSLYISNPKVFVEVQKPHFSQILLRQFYERYLRLIKDIVRLKNSQKAVEWEHGIKVYEESIDVLVKEKEEILSKLVEILYQDLRHVRDIKGVKDGQLVKLLAIAHPRDFPSLSRYLAYCGCKASSFWKTFENGKGKGRGKFNREAKATLWYMATEVLMQQKRGRGDWYLYYEKCKETLKNRGVEKSLHAKAHNRLQTEIAKFIYKQLHNMPLLEDVKVEKLLSIEEFFSSKGEVEPEAQFKSDIDLNSTSPEPKSEEKSVSYVQSNESISFSSFQNSDEGKSVINFQSDISINFSSSQKSQEEFFSEKK